MTLARTAGVESLSKRLSPRVLEEEISYRDDQRVWFTFPRASYSVEMGSLQFAVLSSGAKASRGRGGKSFED